MKKPAYWLSPALQKEKQNAESKYSGRFIGNKRQQNDAWSAKNCSIYNISVSPDQEALKKCINESIEISTEEIPENETAQRGIIRKKNGAGCYVSIKNVKFFPYLFLEVIIRLIVKDFPPIEIFFNKNKYDSYICQKLNTKIYLSYITVIKNT